VKYGSWISFDNSTSKGYFASSLAPILLDITCESMLCSGSGFTSCLRGALRKRFGRGRDCMEVRTRFNRSRKLYLRKAISLGKELTIVRIVEVESWGSWGSGGICAIWDESLMSHAVMRLR
jgi:hypothetical protein